MSKVTAKELDDFFLSAFDGNPEWFPTTVSVGYGHVTSHYTPQDFDLRPGGYISGPTQMQLADHIAYAAIFTKLGITPMALTTNLNIDFLRPLVGDAIYAKGTIIHLSKKRVLIESIIYADGESNKPSSRATVTFALPPHK